MKVVISGWPRTGKTTFATKLARETGLPLISTGKRSEALDIYTRFFVDLPWDEVPRVVLEELAKYPAGWILEGTQSARVLRHGFETEHPALAGLSRVHYFDNPPWVHREHGATVMGQGVDTVFNGGKAKGKPRRTVRSYLRALGVEVVRGAGE